MDLSIFYLAIAVLYIIPSVSEAVCPHTNSTLKPWSDPASWPNNEVPDEQAFVTIDDNILLDTTPPELHSLTINPGGRLVWSPKGDFTLKLRFLHIKGRMDIGSEDCKFKANARIILTGKRGEYNIPGFGDKFIGVDYGGTLEMHGEEKLSWTKLNKTLPKIKLGDGILYHHKESKKWAMDEWYQGLAIYIIDPHTGAVDDYRVFYLSGLDKWRTSVGKRKIIPFLKNIATDKVVMISTQITLKNTERLTGVFDAIELLAYGSVTRGSLIRRVKKSDAYVMITKTGDSSSTIEKMDRVHKAKKSAFAKVSLNDWRNGFKFTAESHVHEINWKTFVDFWVVRSDSAYPILDVIDDVSTWHVGDKILLTSTDYNHEQAETGVVIGCPECSPKQARVDLEPKFTHWGKIISNVDMRGEVALLTRNIVVEGEMEEECPQKNNGNCESFQYDTFGGHIKFAKGFKDVHIEGIELYNMGKQTDKGHYPFHFHMCGAVDDERYPNPPYLRDNSIHNSFSRCVTIHGTHGVKLVDNVCYNFLGHGYFLEDGGEKRTLLDGNLGVGTKKGSLTPSDETPSTFWITNPLTTLKNNVAAGSEHTGFWFLFPDKPIGHTKALGYMAKDEAKHTAITEFYNNVAHSNKANGLNIDQKLLEDESAGSINEYNPRQDPLNKHSKAKKVLINKMTAYKNNIQNIWVRGGLIEITKSSLSDSARGVIFARSTAEEQYLSDSVILGESENTGEPSMLYKPSTSTWEPLQRSLAIPWDINHPVVGFLFYDGPVYMDNVWFDSFRSNENYKMAAIGFKRQNKFYNSAVSATSGIQFGFDDGLFSGTRVYDGNSTEHGFSSMDGDKGATFRDLDGSVTSVPGIQIVRPGPFYTTSACTYRRNWNMALCPHKYGKIHVKIETQEDKGITMPVMVRDDIPAVSETLTGENSAQFVAILGGSHSYTLHWTHVIPKIFDIYGEGVEKGYPVRIGACLPRNAKFELFSWSPVWKARLDKWVRVSHIRDLDTDTKGGKYYWDKKSRLLFVNLLSFTRRTMETRTDCNGPCPMVRVKILSGDRTKGDCRLTAYPKYRRRSLNGKRRRMKPLAEKTLKATLKSPPPNWGAGPTRPFLSRIPVNGAYSEWLGWSNCSQECGGGNQTRRRLCNDPIPANGGTECYGERLQTRICNTQPCPIDGGFGEWSSWTKCIIVTECQGYQRRIRTCDSPEPRFGGLYCEGTLKETRQCNEC